MASLSSFVPIPEFLLDPCEECFCWRAVWEFCEDFLGELSFLLPRTQLFAVLRAGRSAYDTRKPNGNVLLRDARMTSGEVEDQLLDQCKQAFFVIVG